MGLAGEGRAAGLESEGTRGGGIEPPDTRLGFLLFLRGRSAGEALRPSPPAESVSGLLADES